jgi:hypothetical protein
VIVKPLFQALAASSSLPKALKNQPATEKEEFAYFLQSGIHANAKGHRKTSSLANSGFITHFFRQSVRRIEARVFAWAIFSNSPAGFLEPSRRPYP